MMIKTAEIQTQEIAEIAAEQIQKWYGINVLEMGRSQLSTLANHLDVYLANSGTGPAAGAVRWEKLCDLVELYKTIKNANENKPLPDYIFKDFDAAVTQLDGIMKIVEDMVGK